MTKENQHKSIARIPILEEHLKQIMSGRTSDVKEYILSYVFALTSKIFLESIFKYNYYRFSHIYYSVIKNLLLVNS